MRIVVIGGGISGLTAGYRLRAAGHDATVLEAASRAGGHVTTVRDAGFLVESGPNGFLWRARESEPIGLVRDLGLEGSLVESRPAAKRRFIVHGRKLRPVPAGPLSLVTSDALTAGGKLRLAMEPFVPRATPGARESVHEFARRRLGDEAADVLVDTAVSGISAGDSHALELAAAFPIMVEMERDHGSLVRAMFARRERPARLVSFTRGLATLTDALAERLGPALRTGQRVRRIERAGDAWRVVTEQGDALAADRVLLATSATRAAAMLRELDGELARTLTSFPFAGLAVAAFAFRAGDLPRPLDGYGYLVARDEGLATLGVVWESSLFEGRAPAGHVLMRAMLGGARQPGLVELDDAAIRERALRELSLVLGIGVPPHSSWLWRWPGAIAQYTHGHLDRVEQARALAGRHDGLELLGTSYDGVSFTSAIISAERAVARVLASAGAAGRPSGIAAAARETAARTPALAGAIRGDRP